MMNKWNLFCSQTALMYAAENGHVSIVQALLSYALIDVNAKVCQIAVRSFNPHRNDYYVYSL